MNEEIYENTHNFVDFYRKPRLCSFDIVNDEYLFNALDNNCNEVSTAVSSIRRQSFHYDKFLDIPQEANGEYLPSYDFVESHTVNTASSLGAETSHYKQEQYFAGGMGDIRNQDMISREINEEVEQPQFQRVQAEDGRLNRIRTDYEPLWHQNNEDPLQRPQQFTYEDNNFFILNPSNINNGQKLNENLFQENYTVPFIQSQYIQQDQKFKQRASLTTIEKTESDALCYETEEDAEHSNYDDEDIYSSEIKNLVQVEQEKEEDEEALDEAVDAKDGSFEIDIKEEMEAETVQDEVMSNYGIGQSKTLIKNTKRKRKTEPCKNKKKKVTPTSLIIPKEEVLIKSPKSPKKAIKFIKQQIKEEEGASPIRSNQALRFILTSTESPKIVEDDSSPFKIKQEIFAVHNSSMPEFEKVVERHYLPYRMESDENLEGKKIGNLTMEERRIKVLRYLDKKKRRKWSKKISYDCRKRVADNRLRIKGRFVKREHALRILRMRSDDSIDNELIKKLLEGKEHLLLSSNDSKTRSSEHLLEDDCLSLRSSSCSDSLIHSIKEEKNCTRRDTPIVEYPKNEKKLVFKIFRVERNLIA